jgi:hypothetical protein
MTAGADFRARAGRGFEGDLWVSGPRPQRAAGRPLKSKKKSASNSPKSSSTPSTGTLRSAPGRMSRVRRESLPGFKCSIWSTRKASRPVRPTKRCREVADPSASHLWTCRMRKGISITLKPGDRRRLKALARDRNAPQKTCLAGRDRAAERQWCRHRQVEDLCLALVRTLHALDGTSTDADGFRHQGGGPFLVSGSSWLGASGFKWPVSFF